MKIINDIGNGWKIGRDQKRSTAESMALSDEYDRRLKKMNDELGEDRTYVGPDGSGETNTRAYKVWDEVYSPAIDKEAKLYPRGIDFERKQLGKIGKKVSDIAEMLPRKRKIVKSKPKRKIIKKKIVKKCKCK